MELHADKAHRDTLRAALRGHEDKLVEAIASRQAAINADWKADLKADLGRVRAWLRTLDLGR
jgi:hypothetical protein